MPLRTDCPLCGSADLELVVERHGVPISQNGVERDREAALNAPRGDLRMMVCRRCGFTFNAAFDPERVPYGPGYDNNQLCSTAFTSHVGELVRYLIEDRAVKNARIVEVGCGSGSFLRELVRAPGSGNVGFGFDPSYRGDAVELDGRLRFEARYYDRDCSEVAADVVVCRHVIEHVPEPMALLHSVREALAGARAPRIFFETPCVEWILRNGVVWDFFYEHCSLFSADSLASAFELAGFRVDRVRHVFGDQYLLLEAGLDPNAPPITQPRANAVAELARAYRVQERDFIARWRERIVRLSADAKLALWGAGAKGVTFANLLDPHREMIDCIVDINPNKQGAFVPGTAHPIVAFETLTARAVRRALLMNPNYAAEIAEMLRAAGVELELVA